jgi:hypothetical protein
MERPPLMPISGHNYGVHASDEMAAAAAAYRARAFPGDAELADLLEEAARKAPNGKAFGSWQGTAQRNKCSSQNAGGAMSSLSHEH